MAVPNTIQNIIHILNSNPKKKYVPPIMNNIYVTSANIMRPTFVCTAPYFRHCHATATPRLTTTTIIIMTHNKTSVLCVHSSHFVLICIVFINNFFLNIHPFPFLIYLKHHTDHHSHSLTPSLTQQLTPLFLTNLTIFSNQTWHSNHSPFSPSFFFYTSPQLSPVHTLPPAVSSVALTARSTTPN